MPEPSDALCRAWGQWLVRATLALAGLLLIAHPAAAEAPAPVEEWEGGDASVAPGTDFFRFANGRWLDAHPIPPDRSGFSIATVLRNSAAAEVRALLEEAASAVRDAPPDTVFTSDPRQQLGAYYSACLDEARADALGAAPLAPELAQIRRARTHRALARLMGRANLGQHGTLFNLWIEADLRQPERQRVHLGPAGLDPLSRAHYLDPLQEPVRSAYRIYIRQLLALSGWPEAAAHADRVLALETWIAQRTAGAAEQRDMALSERPITGAGLAALAPGFAWDSFLHAAGLSPGERLALIDPALTRQVARIHAATPVPVLQAWAAFHLADRSAALLSAPYRAAWADFHGKVLRGLEAAPPRWEWAVTQVSGGAASGILESPGALEDAVARLYGERNFDARKAAALQALATDLKSALRSRIRAATWMSPQARDEALRKLQGLTIQVGMPGHLRDYRGLAMRRDDLFGDVMRAKAYVWRQDLAHRRAPSDRGRWNISPQTVNAYHYAPFVQVVFTAALLQPPAYAPGQDDAALLYGGIGAVIGHELMHGFDDVGRQFDAQGRRRDWWTASDQQWFGAKAAQLVAYFSRCESAPGAFVDGRLTLGENIADLGGLQLAWDAYQASLQGRPAPVMAGRTGPQRFFLGFARLRRGQRRPEALRQDLQTDPHTPDACRVNWDVRQLDPWYDAFDVGPDAPLYLAPDARISPW